MIPFLRRIELSSRPLFIVCGSVGSGKHTLITKSGLQCEYLHPAGSSASERETPLWFFSPNAVYILGALEPMSRMEAFYTELKKNRLWRRRAIDGVLMVVDAEDVMKSDEARLRKLAAKLREQANAIVGLTGYRVPVYFVLSKCDKIEGFRELFADKSAADKMPYVGSLTYTGGSSKVSHRELFSSYYKKVCGDLDSVSIGRLIDISRRQTHVSRGASGSQAADTAAARLAICRLTRSFRIAEENIAAFIEAFFGDISRDRPRFGGFFFASSAMEDAETPGFPAAFSSRPLLSEVIPGAKHGMREAGEGTLSHRVKKIIGAALIISLWGIACLLIPGSALRDARHMRGAQNEIGAMLKNAPTVASQYAVMTELLRSYKFLQNGYIPPGRVIFRTGKVRAALLDTYIAASSEILAAPAAARLDASIRRRLERGGEPTADEHQSLYRSLEAYLILTGGYPASPAPAFDRAAAGKVVEQSLRSALGADFRNINPDVLREHIDAVLDLAAAGLLTVPQNENTAAEAREKLARTPRADIVYITAMERLRADGRNVPMNRIMGRSELVRNAREVSALYTREGWESRVFAALIDASKDPFKNNWVTGPARIPVDEDKLLAELVTLYANDLRGRWIDFIRSSSLNLPADLTALSGDLEKLASQRSEIGRTLAVACSLAAQPPLETEMSDMPGRGASVADIKGQIGALTNRLRGALANMTGDVPDPFKESASVFEPINEFLTGGGFLAYRNDLSELAKVIRQCAERGGFVPAFLPRGGENVITRGRKNLSAAYSNMPDETAYIVRRLLEAPFDHASAILVRAVSEELEEAWAGEVAGYFNGRLAGRYPFKENAPDAPYSDFEEFFKPQSGVLWRHVDQNLSGIIEHTPRGWAQVAKPPIAVSVRAEALQSIDRAGKITEAFFRRGGSEARQDITFTPFTSSFGTARLMIGGKAIDFPGGLPVTVSHAPNAPGVIVLQAASANRDAGEIRFSGEWAMARFFDAAKTERLAGGRYRARWPVNVQNIYTAQVTTVAEGNAAAVFDPSIVRDYGVPGKILR